MARLKDLKRGEFFTLREIPEPKDNQVYIRGEYDRSLRKYTCGRCDDISYSRNLSGDKEVYTGFIY